MVSILRFKLFHSLLLPFSRRMRARRMRRFVETMGVQPGMRVLDLGGKPAIWDAVPDKLDITCLNLPGAARTDHPSHHSIAFIEGDACSLPDINPDEFDLIFSNSVIEHVGDRSRRQAFADGVRRLECPYWIQTPSKYFPVECHSGMPLWWFYPDRLRRHLLDRWQRELPRWWTEMVKTTTVVTRGELRRLFPAGRIKHEWLLFPKSMIAFRPCESEGEPTRTPTALFLERAPQASRLDDSQDRVASSGLR